MALADFNDFLNDAEALIVTKMKAHSAITDVLGDANKIIEKLRDNPTAYSDSEIPAVAVGAYEWVPELDRISTIKMVAEVACIGADLAVIDGQAKHLLALIATFLRNQVEKRNGNLFDYEVEDVRVVRAATAQFEMVDDEGGTLGVFWAGGSVQFEIMIVN